MARKTPEPTEGESVEAPGVIPEGVEADVTVKYRRRVNPQENASDLDALALEADADLSPPDPLAEFLDNWQQCIGYNCEVVRLPDPADRRMPSAHYARPNFGEIERLGGVPFDPVNFVPALQMINGNSGGVFRVWLTDNAGQMIPGARLERLAIADPPGAKQSPQLNMHQQPAPQTERYQPSQLEQQMQQLQAQLLQTALDRALNPAPPAAPPAAPSLPDEDRLALMLFKQGNLLGPIIEKIASTASQVESAGQSTWKDKAMDYVMQNPQVGMQLTGAAERVITGLTNLVATILPGASQTSSAPQPIQHAPQATPAAQAAPAPAPEAEPIDVEDEQETEDMELLEEIVTVLSGDEPLAGNPIFQQLQKDFPERFPFYVNLIAKLPSADMMLTFIGKLTPLYRKLINGPMRDHYLKRAEELRQLCIAATTPPPTSTEAAPAQPAGK